MTTTLPTTTSGNFAEPFGIVAGLPDAELIARLANELFAALPGHPQDAVPKAPASETLNTAGVPGVQAFPADAGVPAAATPTEAELDALSGAFGLAASAAGFADAPTPDRLPGFPGFYFLDAGKAAPKDSPEVPDSFSIGLGQGVPPLDVDARPFDPHAVRRDFPILQEEVHGKPLVWLDNGATTQKPQAVIDRLSCFYEHENSNIHRAAHELAARSEDAYEGARDKVRHFLNADSPRTIVFVRGSTEGINLVAQSWGRRNVGKDDEIVITWLEHHANIVPWQQLCAEKGAVLRVAPVDDTGQVILEEYEKLLNARTKIVAFTHVSNALGTITPAREMIAMAHRHGARVLLDGAQSVPHKRIDVQELDCDWFVFSGHKMFAPTGIGAVYGKEDLLNETPPWQGGGNMIVDVTFEKTVYQPAPARFEAGTGNIADAVGLGAAIDYLDRVGMENISRYEHLLLEYATGLLNQVPGLRLYGTAKEKAGVLSFTLAGFDSVEVGKVLDREGIAVRAGHHCAQPILRRFGVEATVRASLALYNTCEDIDRLVAALLKIRSTRGG